MDRDYSPQTFVNRIRFDLLQDFPLMSQQQFSQIFSRFIFLPVILRGSQHLNKALYRPGTNAVGSIFCSSFVFSYGEVKSKYGKLRKRGQKSVHFSMRLSVWPLLWTGFSTALSHPVGSSCYKWYPPISRLLISHVNTFSTVPSCPSSLQVSIHSFPTFFIVFLNPYSLFSDSILWWAMSRFL